MIKKYPIFIKENLDEIKNILDDCEITYKNLEEMKNICQILMRFGYIVYNSDVIMKSTEVDWFNYVIDKDKIKGFEYDYVRSGVKDSPLVKYHINYEQLLELIEPKAKIKWYHKGKFEKLNHIKENIDIDEIINSLINSQISYETLEEMKDICKSLADLGFTIYNYDGIMNSGEMNYRNFIYKCDNDGYNFSDFSRSNKIDYDYKQISYAEFSDLMNKSKSKIRWYYKGKLEKLNYIKENIDISEKDKEFLTSCQIFYTNVEEMINICRILTDLGFVVYNSDEIMKSNRLKYASYVPNKGEDYNFVRTHNNYDDKYEQLDYEKFIELTQRKPKIRWYYKGKLEK